MTFEKIFQTSKFNASNAFKMRPKSHPIKTFATGLRCDAGLPSDPVVRDDTARPSARYAATEGGVPIGGIGGNATKLKIPASYQLPCLQPTQIQPKNTSKTKTPRTQKKSTCKKQNSKTLKPRLLTIVKINCSPPVKQHEH